jgi:hypothetical protein
MVYFQTKNPKFGQIWRAMEDVGIFYGHLVYFVVNLIYFLSSCCTNTNLATLMQERFYFTILPVTLKENNCFFVTDQTPQPIEDVSLNVSVVWGARATGTNLYWCSDSWHKTKGHICLAQQPFIWIARVREGWATKKPNVIDLIRIVCVEKVK